MNASKKTLPRRSDFVTAANNLDQESAYRRMGGKSRDEVLRMLEYNYLLYQEMFMFMGLPAFLYYEKCLACYVAVQCLQTNIEPESDVNSALDDMRISLLIYEHRSIDIEDMDTVSVGSILCSVDFINSSLQCIQKFCVEDNLKKVVEEIAGFSEDLLKKYAAALVDKRASLLVS